MRDVHLGNPPFGPAISTAANLGGVAGRVKTGGVEAALAER
jgi:hypothetical protein